METNREADNDGNQVPNMTIIKMEEIMDKLKLLDYEIGFCKKLKFRPFPRHYFALATNSGEQFYYFSNVSVYLLNLCGCNLPQPQESDDPNATISTIIDECKKLGITTNFPPTKLKTGSGEHVCHILKSLTDTALNKTRFTWQKPAYPREEDHEEINDEGRQELTLSMVDDHIHEDVDDSDDEEGGAVFLDISNTHTDNSKGVPTLGNALEPSVDPEEWEREVERVLPSLKMKLKQDNNRDWRLHYEQMHQYHDNIKSTLSDTKIQLDKLHSEIGKTLEKISSREKYIKNQLEAQVGAYRTKKDELAAVRNKYKEGNSSVNELSQRLAEVTMELEKVKEELNERGNSMTDAGPVVRIKQALTTLKKENNEMEVQLGLLEHTSLDIHYRTKNAMKLQMAGGTTFTSKSSELF